MTNQEVGLVTLKYNTEGKVIEASFQPSIMSLMGAGLSSLADNLVRIPSSQRAEVVKETSDILFANWFNQMNTIELADPAEGKLVSEVVFCDKWEDDSIKECRMMYTFQQT